jgi:hypothetical protein
MAIKKKDEDWENDDEESSSEAELKRDSQCIVCKEKAEFCMRGLPKNTYCRDCAEAYFGLLEYLDKLES